jgi:hypothetical protein
MGVFCSETTSNYGCSVRITWSKRMTWNSPLNHLASQGRAPRQLETTRGLSLAETCSLKSSCRGSRVRMLSTMATCCAAQYVDESGRYAGISTKELPWHKWNNLQVEW